MQTRVFENIIKKRVREDGIDWITVSVLCFVNLINYMDRFTIAGMYSLDFNMLMIMVMSCPKLIKICKVRVQCCRNANGNKK